jgi:hypothetical protein
MPMGRERAVTRWDTHAALLERERARIEGELAALGEPTTPERRNRAERLLRARDEVLSRQRALGPSPRAKMG